MYGWIHIHNSPKIWSSEKQPTCFNTEAIPKKKSHCLPANQISLNHYCLFLIEWYCLLFAAEQGKYIYTTVMAERERCGIQEQGEERRPSAEGDGASWEAFIMCPSSSTIWNSPLPLFYFSHCHYILRINLKVPWNTLDGFFKNAFIWEKWMNIFEGNWVTNNFIKEFVIEEQKHAWSEITRKQHPWVAYSMHKGKWENNWRNHEQNEFIQHHCTSYTHFGIKWNLAGEHEADFHTHALSESWPKMKPWRIITKLIHNNMEWQQEVHERMSLKENWVSINGIKSTNGRGHGLRSKALIVTWKSAYTVSEMIQWVTNSFTKSMYHNLSGDYGYLKLCNQNYKKCQLYPHALFW